MLFGNVSSPPNYWDMEIGRKVRQHARAFANLMRLTQHFNCIHFAGGYPVEPVDIHPSVRHLDVLFDKLTITDKVAHAYCLGPERVEDVMEMVRIAAGLRGRRVRARAADVHQHQLDLAPEARPADDRRLPADDPAGPGGDRDALHAGRARWRR